MPQLPSGRHVAITANPLADILDDVNNPSNVHIVMGIATHQDLEPYIDVLFLIPETEAAENAIHSGYIENSLPPPPKFVPVNSGYRLSGLSELTHDWDETDKAAFQEFLCGRATTTFDSCMKEVRRAQLAMRNSSNSSIRLLATWWIAGCHPAQEEGWNGGGEYEAGRAC